MTKKLVKQHFFYYWYIYAIFIGIIAVVVTWSTKAIIAVKTHEKVQYFVGASKIERGLLIDDVLKEDSSCMDCGILSCSLNDPNFYAYLTSAGVVETDFIIIPDAFVSVGFVTSYCRELNSIETKLNQIYPFKYEKMMIDNFEATIGIVIYDKDEDYSIFNKYFTYNIETTNYKKYYLFINKDTCNMNSLIYYPGASSDHATNALKTMVKYEE